jgi:hypothetical protein
MDRIWQMINKKAPGGSRPSKNTDWSFGPEDEKAIHTASLRNPETGLTLNEKLNSGMPLTPEEQRQADALRQALAKLPSHEGPVVRHTTLSPEELARYEPGMPVTENGFTYSTLRPDGIDQQFVQSQNVEFQIVSKTGVRLGEYAPRPDDVMFPSGTGFMVHDRIVLPNGRVIIQMTEI